MTFVLSKNHAESHEGLRCCLTMQDGLFQNRKFTQLLYLSLRANFTQFEQKGSTNVKFHATSLIWKFNLDSSVNEPKVTLVNMIIILLFI